VGGWSSNQKYIYQAKVNIEQYKKKKLNLSSKYLPFLTSFSLPHSHLAKPEPSKALEPSLSRGQAVQS
jgi:hypothetical protein